MTDRFSPTLDDANRLAALYRYNLAEGPDVAFDRVTRLAANIFEVPIALVSLLDLQRQWFKSSVGISVCETDRDFAFCGYVLVAKKPLVILDALADERFAQNPLVTGYPQIRFYAGAPIITTDGYPLGTVCVIDQNPRPAFTPREELVLTELADLVMHELDLRLEYAVGRVQH